MRAGRSGPVVQHALIVRRFITAEQSAWVGNPLYSMSWLLCSQNAAKTGCVFSALAAPLRTNAAPMKKTSAKRSPSRVVAERDDILPEYDFRGARRNPYARRLAAGAIAVVIDPDVAAVFTDAKAVNDALRALAKVIADQARRRAGHGTA